MTSRVLLTGGTVHMDHSLEHLATTAQDVSDLFQHLDITKACVPDSICPRLLKERCHILPHLMESC